MNKKYLVEFLGTTFLVFTIFATNNWLAIGSALAFAVLLGGSISGGAFNPAVAIALYAAGKLPKNDLIPYIIVEILGSLLAFYMYKRFVNKSKI
jgi:aquaporin Z